MLYKYENIYFHSARRGQADNLKLLIGYNKNFSAKITLGCAFGGHLELLQWARKNGCEMDRSVCAYAAKNGHLEVLQWARNNGCEWDTRTCAYAALNGHLEVLQWARNNGCDMG